MFQEGGGDGAVSAAEDVVVRRARWLRLERPVLRRVADGRRMQGERYVCSAKPTLRSVGRSAVNTRVSHTA